MLMSDTKLLIYLHRLCTTAVQ